MSKPIKFNLVKTDNKALKAYDAKVLLQIARATENQKKLELQMLDLKISEVDKEIAETLLEKESAGKPAAASHEEEKREQKVKKVSQIPPLVLPQHSGTVKNSQNEPQREVQKPIAREAPSSLGRQSALEREFSGCAQTVRVYSKSGFHTTQTHEIHKEFSEAGKVIDIRRSEDNYEVFIKFESVASARSAVKHPPSVVGNLHDLEVYRADNNFNPHF